MSENVTTQLQSVGGKFVWGPPMSKGLVKLTTVMWMVNGVIGLKLGPATVKLGDKFLSDSATILHPKIGAKCARESLGRRRTAEAIVPNIPNIKVYLTHIMAQAMNL